MGTDFDNRVAPGDALTPEDHDVPEQRARLMDALRELVQVYRRTAPSATSSAAPDRRTVEAMHTLVRVYKVDARGREHAEQTLGRPLADILHDLRHAASSRSNRREQVRAQLAQRSSKAITSVAGAFRKNAFTLYLHTVEEIRGELIPEIDPTTISWDVFRLFNRERSETSWTAWVANILRPSHGTRCASTVWRAVCLAVADQPEPIPCRPSAGDRVPASMLAAARHWREAASHATNATTVEDELAVEELGRLDLVVEAPPLLAIVENKLWEGWHDWQAGSRPITRQADRYRTAAVRRAAQRDELTHVGLIYLTADDDVRSEVDGGDVPSDWTILPWRRLSIQLRAQLRVLLGPEPSPRDLIELWPIVLTLVALEQNILELYENEGIASLLEAAPSVSGYRALLPLSEYLRRVRREQEKLVR